MKSTTKLHSYNTHVTPLNRSPSKNNIYIPGVAGAVLQSPPSFIHSLTDSFTDPLVQISSKYCQSQTGRARELNFWENAHPTLCVMCHVSCVTCHVSRVMCHLSPVTCHMSKNIKYNFFVSWKKIEQSVGASRWRVCNQRGLPCLVFSMIGSLKWWTYLGLKGF